MLQIPHGFCRGAHQHLSSVVDDAEISLVLQFLGFVELGMRSLFLQDLLHEALVRGFGEPALLIQESQDSWRTCLETQNTGYNQRKSSFGDLYRSTEDHEDIMEIKLDLVLAYSMAFQVLDSQ